ncbi:MAG TPA: hypothetical protein VF746_17235 [Longimicrobium sp.]|jgi:hypothetical protein
MRGSSALAALLLLAACTPPATETTTAPAPAPRAAAAAPDRGVFALVQGGTDVFTESFTRTPERLETVLTGPAGNRAAITADLATDATVTRIRVEEFRRADTVAARTSEAVFMGDSVFLEQAGQGPPLSARRQIPAGSIPFVNPSPSLLEQIVRRARAIGGSPVQVPIWAASGGGQPATATVILEGNQARIQISNVEVQLTLDESGRVFGGGVPVQGLTLERRPPGATAPAPAP